MSPYERAWDSPLESHPRWGVAMQMKCIGCKPATVFVSGSKSLPAAYLQQHISSLRIVMYSCRSGNLIDEYISAARCTHTAEQHKRLYV